MALDNLLMMYITAMGFIYLTVYRKNKILGDILFITTSGLSMLITDIDPSVSVMLVIISIGNLMIDGFNKLNSP